MNPKEAQSRAYLLAQQLEVQTRHYRVPLRAVSQAVLPTALRLYFEPDKTSAAKTRIEQIKNALDNLCLGIGVERMYVGWGNGLIHFDIPLEIPPIYLTQKYLESVPPECGLLGILADGKPIVVKLSPQNAAHVLISGMSGSGKTEMMRTLALTLAHGQKPRNLQFVLFDPKRRAFNSLAYSLRGLLSFVAQSDEECLAGMKHLSRLVESRVADQQNARVIALVDELPTLCEKCGDEFNSSISHIADAGREMGVHLICVSQKPSSKAIPEAVRGNSLRIALRCATYIEANMAAGIAGTGAEKFNLHGEAVMAQRGELIRITTILTAPAAVPAGWQPPGVPTEVMRRVRTSPTVATKAATLRDMWGSASDEDRRLLVAEHIVSNAIQTGVVLGDGRGALSGNLYTKLVAGRAAAGDLLTGNLMRIYNAASSTSTNPSSTTPQNPSPAPKTGGEGAKVEVELAITGQI